MADFSTIQGQPIQSFASDPVASVVAGGTWAAGNDVNTGKLNPVGFGASQNAALKTVGEGGSPSGVTNKTELYDGTSWTEVADGSQSVQAGAGFGTTAAGINVGGSPASPANITQIWDGTSWADTNDCITAIAGAGGGLGTSTAGMKFGGNPTEAGSETWNGTSWTEGNNINQGTYGLMGAGTTTAGILAGGAQPPNTNYDLASTYDGTSWTAITAMGTGRSHYAASTSGTQTAYLAAGGGPDTPAYTANTEYWDGSAWTEVADLATAVANGCSAGTVTSALSATGRGPGNIPFGIGTEEWTASSTATIAQEGQVWYNTTSNVLKGFGKIGTGAWASGGTMPVNLTSGAYSGTQTAGVYAGGNPGDVNTTYLYDGSVWTTSPATLNDGRHYLASTGIGTQTAAQIMGGESPAVVGVTEQFDGSTWTEVADLNYNRIAVAGAGTQAAGLAMTGGHNVSANSTTYVESWDGTSWTNTTAAPHSKKYTMGGGTQTSAFTAGGNQYPPNVPMLSTSETWNGTAWTEEAAINTARNDGSRGAASGTAALIFSGNDTPTRGAAESWDGTTWTTEASLATARQAAAGSGTSMSSIAAGGQPIPVGLGYTEEWTIPDATKTFTSS